MQQVEFLIERAIELVEEAVPMVELLIESNIDLSLKCYSNSSILEIAAGPPGFGADEVDIKLHIDV